MNTKSIIKKLYREIPSFKDESLTKEIFVSHLYNEEELYEVPYTVFQDLSVFILSKINQQGKNIEDERILESCFKFIGEILVSSEIENNPDLLDLIYLGLLTPLADTQEVEIFKYAEKYLDKKTFISFQKYTNKIIQNQPFYD